MADADPSGRDARILTKRTLGELDSQNEGHQVPPELAFILSKRSNTNSEGRDSDALYLDTTYRVSVPNSSQQKLVRNTNSTPSLIPLPSSPAGHFYPSALQSTPISNLFHYNAQSLDSFQYFGEAPPPLGSSTFIRSEPSAGLPGADAPSSGTDPWWVNVFLSTFDKVVLFSLNNFRCNPI